MGTVSDDQLTLFTHRNSPYAERVQIALLEKGIPFKPIYVDLRNKPKELLEANPIYAKVPTMVHKGTPLAESQVILEYLEEAWPDKVPLMPKDALEKSKVRFWSDYIYKGLYSVVEGLRIKPGTPEKQASNEGIVKMLETLDQAIASFSAEGPFFTGDKFGLLDVMLAPLTCCLLVLEKVSGVAIAGPDKLPRLHKWIEVVKAHPSVTSTLPTGEENLNFAYSMMKIRAEMAAAAAATAQ